MSEETLRDERIKKLRLLEEAGMPAYPARVDRSITNEEFLRTFDEKENTGVTETIVGRVMALRGQGGILFAVLFDGTERVQIVLQKSEMMDVERPSSFQLFADAVDLGDFVEATGVYYRTKRGERSLNVRSWRMLTKALLPIPSEWFGLKDTEEKLRKRYLDILVNKETRDLVVKRAKFWEAVRVFHKRHDFLEVETPTLEVTTGGGDARPFKTHHHALDMNVYLRISVGELWQKRLMVAGLPKTFEIGRMFRNEGMSAEHAQDYTQCEAYWAYANYTMMYTFLRQCLQYAAHEAFGTLQFEIRGHTIDLSGEWPTIDYAAEIARQTGVDIWSANEGDIIRRLEELQVAFTGEPNRPRLVDTLWKYCRKNIGGPAILVNEPKDLSPLSKTNPDDARTVERFHFIIAGSEVANGYSELNDPIDQRARFEEQQRMRDAGDEEAQMADWDFVEALEYGMPPTAGHGFSERFFAFLAGKPIQEAQIFPLMRPR